MSEIENPVTWGELTEEVKTQFSQNGDIKVCDRYITGENSETIYYRKAEVDAYIAAVNKRQTYYYEKTDFYLYCALEKYNIENKSVAVFGSVTPWYESICLGFGGVPYTIEYNKRLTDDDRLNFYEITDDNPRPWGNKKFDAAFSISSFEHDGLGRYGDPINPDGDLLAMENLKKHALKSGGLLFLAVPCGIDKVCWNAHRIYGNKRLGRLTEGFELLETFPTNIDNLLTTDTGVSGAIQPILVLVNG